MKTLRDGLSSAFRLLPDFRGKSRSGATIGRWLTDMDDEKDCLATIRMRDGSIMRVDVRSRTEEWAYWTGDYDGAIIARLRTCLTPGCVVLDVGANVGFYSISLGNTLKTIGGKLFAFEPVPSNVKRIEETISLNGLEKTVRTFNVALGNEEGFIELAMENDHGATTGNAVMITDTIADEIPPNVTAAITRLDLLAEEQKIESCRLIKVDIEGAEVMFLRGAAGFIRAHRPIIYGEFNSYWIKRFGCSFLDAVALLAPIGYRFFKQTSQGEFAELVQPKDGDEDLLMAPLETPVSTLRELGVTGL